MTLTPRKIGQHLTKRKGEPRLSYSRCGKHHGLLVVRLGQGLLRRMANRIDIGVVRS